MANPMTFAHICLCEGEQGSGKSTVAVARPTDATFANVTSIRLSNGVFVKARPLDKPKVGYAKITCNAFPDLYVITRVPKGSCVIADSIKIWANFHFYGIRATYLTLAQMIEYLNQGLISDGYLICDEHYIGGNARDGMTAVVKTFNKLKNQMRKRHLHLILCAPIARMIDWTSRWSATEHIECSYNEHTYIITVTIKKKGERRSRVIPFYAPIYWPYFDTDELIGLSENEVNNAVAMAR